MTIKKQLLLGVLILGLLTTSGCLADLESDVPTASSGVKKAAVKVQTDLEGATVEQQNVRNRLLADNRVGAIKHLYIISPYSGKILLYSTVKGKVTSSGKRLTPLTVSDDGAKFPLRVGNTDYLVNEVLQDDGTYGSSDPYIYWWDSKGIYHQHFLTGGQIIHVSDKILRVNPSEIQINLETDKAN